MERRKHGLMLLTARGRAYMHDFKYSDGCTLFH